MYNGQATISISYRLLNQEIYPSKILLIIILLNKNIKCKLKFSFNFKNVKTLNQNENKYGDKYENTGVILGSGSFGIVFKMKSIQDPNKM